jgi:hypothetical protein
VQADWIGKYFSRKTSQQEENMDKPDEDDVLELARQAGMLEDSAEGEASRSRFDALRAVAVKTGTLYPMDHLELITILGKFHRCPIYAPYFHAMCGDGDVIQVLEDGMGSYIEAFEPDDEEKALFPALRDYRYLVLTEDSQGFVSVELTDDYPEPDDEDDTAKVYHGPVLFLDELRPFESDTALEEGTRMERAFGDGNDVGG